MVGVQGYRDGVVLGDLGDELRERECTRCAVLHGVARKVVGTAEKPLDLVFHGGSGSSDAEIAEAVKNGVIKMNVDTDTQYAFTRSIAGYMFENYEGVLKIDGEVGNKKKYDPRAWGKVAETAMAARVVESTRHLGSHGNSLTI